MALKKKEAEKDADQKPAPRKKVTVSFIMDASVNQNEFKNWVKSCPVSHEGGQSLTWENLDQE